MVMIKRNKKNYNDENEIYLCKFLIKSYLHSGVENLQIKNQSSIDDNI